MYVQSPVLWGTVSPNPPGREVTSPPPVPRGQRFGQRAGDRGGGGRGNHSPRTRCGAVDSRKYRGLSLVLSIA